MILEMWMEVIIYGIELLIIPDIFYKSTCTNSVRFQFGIIYWSEVCF